MDIRVRVSGGGHVAQIYAIRQAISKALIAFYQKCKCEHILLSTYVCPDDTRFSLGALVFPLKDTFQAE